MDTGVKIVIGIVAVIVMIGQIGGCVSCESKGGVYVKNAYGWYSCVNAK